MVYLDNAATTYPKPIPVIASMSRAMVDYGGNPGRAGHKLSMETAQAVFNSRLKCAEFFGAEPENVVFTLNCTHALNLAIKGIITPSAHLIISDIEHNAVLRPVHATSKENGVSYSIARTTNDDDETVRNFEKLINSRTKAIICTAASNVTGKILPLKKLAIICRERKICLIADAAQGAGVLKLRLSDGINIICTAGHKGLYGPMGTGLMLTDGKFRLKTIIEGGTGSFSKEIEQPEVLPDRFESGTINTSGAIALGAGIDFIKEKTTERIYKHEHSLCELFYNEIKQNNKIHLYTDTYEANRVPLVPFNVGNLESSEAAALFSNQGFYLRGGFHCAFSAHKKMGTQSIGAIRFAPSVFTTRNEVLLFIKAVHKIGEKSTN
ncbi:MAG: aminotransferase class V-fold PLP-dependent enzyme [Oscillospiraceae bacterium]|nr:aminotransferase class V-fold PLP-dependent enzyme [Oscillospiraceae bacterium]